MRTILVLFLLSVAFSTLTCDADKVYVKLYKVSKNYADEEKFEIYSGSQLLQSSPTFSNNGERTMEYCIATSANNQYTLKLLDMGGDSWSSGSFLTIYGEYENAVFKTFMLDNDEEVYDLSLYYPIRKAQEWKMTVSSTAIASEWNTLSFTDADWESVTLASSIGSRTGTQYFRKTFAGLAGMAAYEFDFKYQYGIVAYVNGKEIFREYIADGAVTPSTPSTGAYERYSFHGVIRPAMDVSGSTNVLAVELHFPASIEYPVQFDAFVAALASSTPTSEGSICYVYAYDATLTGNSDASKVFDFTKNNNARVLTSTLPLSITYTLNGPRQMVNGMRIYPHTRPLAGPTAFTVEGSMDGTTYTTIISKEGVTYQNSVFAVFNTIFKAKPYKSYRFNGLATSQSYLYLHEVQPVTCMVPLPAFITFPKTAYSFYAVYQAVEIAPSLNEFSGCSVSPVLPAGLSINPETCVISGTASAASAPVTYTVTSSMDGANYQGSFSLEFTSCAGTFVNFLRTYKGNAPYETFTVTDVATQQVVLNVEYNTVQTNNQDMSTLLCLTSSKYMIDIGSRSVNWAFNSFLYVNAILFGDEYETIARIRYDNRVGLPQDREINAKWSVAPHSTWSYKRGEVPANWYSGDVSQWETGSKDSFQASTNQIQLYRTSFTVDSLENVAGVSLSLRYLYGCVIYLNGVEVFRNGVDGDLSASSIGLNAYTDLLYRKITLPARTLAIGDTPAVNYLQQGNNVIAIAIVAQTASQTASVFDCAVRLMNGKGISRAFDFSASGTGIDGNIADFMGHYYAYSIRSSTCSDNSWTLVFNNDRREWISSMTLYLFYDQNLQQPKQFTLKARNNNLEEWTTLKTVTGMTWSLVGEQKKLWIENNKPYNQYRLENIATGDASACAWKLGTADLQADPTVVEVPELTYPSSIIINKDIEMGEVYPNSDYYFDFAITPALPVGIVIDPNTGKISGTATTLMPATACTITAKKFTGGQVTVPVTISVELCTGTKSLITLVAMTDPWPEEAAYKLYSGKDTSGQLVSSVTAFRAKSALNYGDFCVAHGIYTLEVTDSGNDGWRQPAGWWLTVDLGTMVFEMGQLGLNDKSVTTRFSSYLPFQINYDDWRVFNSASVVSEDWTAVDFDDSAWLTVKAADMGNHMATTAYIRHEVSIPSLEDYAVLNVRVKYAGGVAVYFNGRLVARFNLAESFDASTEAITLHDATSFSVFHIILSSVGAVAGKNVMAFEVHRATGQSAIVFDATGVFGVNECSPVLDSYSAVDATEGVTCNKEDLLSLNPTLFGSIPNEVGSYLAWTVENLEGSKFNSFALHTGEYAQRYGFSVYGRYESVDEYTSMLFMTNQTLLERNRNAWPVPVGVAGFKQLKFEVDAVANTDVVTNAYILQFCKSSSTGSCPAMGEYPSVGEGEISPAGCPEGFRGYAYRECHNGVLGEVKMDKCEYKVPDRLQYENNNMVFVMGTQGSSGIPSYRNIITEFSMQEDTPLPEGFTLNAETGEITGKPTKEMEVTNLVVVGKNPKAITVVAISIRVRKGQCPSEGVFESVAVGETSVYQCSEQGNYVGTQKRRCVLGEKDGVWEKASGNCVSVIGIVILILVVIVVVVIVVLVVVRRTHKAKAKGGVKGKAKVMKKAEEKKKAVKV